MNRLAPIFICWDNSIPPPCFFDGLTHGSNKVLLPNHLSFFHFRCFLFSQLQNWQDQNQEEPTRDLAGMRGAWVFKYSRRADQAQVNVLQVIRTAAGERDSLGERHLKSTDKTTPKPPLMELRKKWVILHPPCVISCLYESLWLVFAIWYLFQPLSLSVFCQECSNHVKLSHKC